LAKYEQELGVQAEEEGVLNQAKADIAKIEADLDFLEQALNAARLSRPGVEAQVEAANANVRGCMDDGVDVCVTAQKEIYLLLSANEVDKLLTLDR